MIKEVTQLTSESSTANLAFEIPISEAPKGVREKNKDRETLIYAKPVMLVNRGNAQPIIDNAKERFKKSDKDLQMFVVKLELPEDFDFEAKFGSQAERMKKTYKDGFFGTCIVPLTWKHLPDYKGEKGQTVSE